MASTTPEAPVVQAEDRPQSDKKDAQDPSLTPTENNGDKQDRSGDDKADEEDVQKIKDVGRAQSPPPPLPSEEVPPLPNEPTPGQDKDDGWDAMWDDNAQAYYFYNRFTGVSQWENPRVPDVSPNQPGPPGVDNHQDQDGQGAGQLPREQPPARGGYDPAVHGDYDPNAWYAQQNQEDTSAQATSTDPNYIYTTTGTFNRFTGKWQSAGVAPENFNDENKSRRQMNAYFDVDAAANSHEGKSLKAERSGKKLTKKELKAFKDKRRERKEEKRRAWLRD